MSYLTVGWMGDCGLDLCVHVDLLASDLLATFYGYKYSHQI